MNRTIGRYEIEEEIGRGNMASVHRAFDPRLQRKLAIKLLRPKYARDEAYRRNFLTEAHAAGRLSHPAILTVHDVGVSDGTPYIAMELLEGATLQQRVRDKGPLRAKKVVHIAIQIALALDYAHRKGVVHRDVKADNIMLASHGTQPKLTDFGIARLRQPDARNETTEEIIVGTPDYMAPEQLMGGDIDGRADLYALGVLMYFLLSGRLPFARDSTASTLAAIANESPPPLRPRDSRAPRALVQLVETLMAKAPAERYQTGAELAEELVQIERELESAGRGRWRMPVTVRWPAVMGLVVAVTLVVGATIVYFQQRAAMTELVFDYGASMAATIGADVAEDLLLGDEVAVRAMVLDIQRNQQMAYLSITDRDGRVVASSREADVGQPRQALPAGETVAERDGLGRVGRHNIDGDELFLFQSPVVYRDQRIGELTLGVSRAPLNSALNVSLLAMASLMLATVLTVLVGTWVLSWRLRIPLRLLGRALDKAGKGHLGHRIRIHRRDEFGDLFGRYNLMAELLETRQRDREQEPEEGPPVTPQGAGDTAHSSGGTRRLGVVTSAGRRR